MAVLRRRGVSFKEIGERVGCSERTARRIARDVQPELHLPQSNPERETNWRVLQDQVLADLMAMVYHNRQLRAETLVYYSIKNGAEYRAEYDGPPSILLLAEAERLFQEALNKLGIHALNYLAETLQSKQRFFTEIIGDIVIDYIEWHRAAQSSDGDPFDTGEDWRPASERILDATRGYGVPYWLGP